MKSNITYIRGNVTEDLWELTRDSLVLHQDNWTSSVVNRLKSFENELVMAMRYRGWDGSEDLNSLQWTFHGALFYSIIVITTIGTQSIIQDAFPESFKILNYSRGSII